VKAAGATVLFAITLLRFRVLLDPKRSHSALIGTFLGALALSINDLFVTYSQIDAVLGGHNWLHLVRNVLVLGAMWALRMSLFEAIQKHPWPRIRKRLEATFAAGVTVIMLWSFSLIDKSPTTAAFIPDHIGQLSALMYGTVYMLAAAALMLDTSLRAHAELRSRRGRRARIRVALGLLSFGTASMAAASVIECIYMAADHTHDTRGPVILVTHAAFGPLFLGGAGLTAVGLLVLAVSGALRRWKLGDRYYLGRLVSIRQESFREGLSVAMRSPSPREDLYTAMISVFDEQSREIIRPCPRRDGVMHTVERRFGA
jgi:hypothetical protein